MTRDEHERYDELVAGHALSALEPAEEQELLAHVAACARCEAALAEHTETLSHLAYAVAAPELPDGMLERLREGMVASGRPVAFPADQPAPVVVPLVDLAEQRRFRRAGAWLGAAAAAVLVLGLGVWNLDLREDRQQQLAISKDLQEALRDFRGGELVPLSGEGETVTAMAVVHESKVSLVVDGLQANDAKATSYVLWQKGQYGDVTAVGAFDVRDGRIDVVHDLPLRSSGGVSGFAVTLEDGNTPPPVARGPVLASGVMD